MTDAAIANVRLRRQHLHRAALRRPEDVVSWFGAMQAQEYQAATWAIGLRTKAGTAAGVERAFNEGRILRTHVMRPTWHFVAPADIRWLIELTGPCVQRRMAVYNRQLGLDDRTLARMLRVVERALRDGDFLTRAQLAERLRHAKMPVRGFHLAHVMMHAECEGVICSGPRQGKQFTYALLEHRAPRAKRLGRDEALAELGRRFFSSHGPATIRDFVWWSGLSTADARRAVEMIDARGEDVGGLTYWTAGSEPRGAALNQLAHLLPIYDEYLVAYRDRAAVPHLPAGATAGWRPANYQHTVVIDGQVAGTWRSVRRVKSSRLEAALLRRLARSERTALGEAAQRYERFVATPIEFRIR